ncbi:MAG: hypothetical protein H7301_03795 [Cryobacterium sp.]|nr:hypothetical protein [Oligoflexia bacterium]
MDFRNIAIQKPELRALGERLGEGRIRALVFDFYARMSSDLMIGFFFDGKDLSEISNLQTSFVLRAMGITSSYVGRSPANAHSELPPILSGHFDRRLQLLDAALTHGGLSPEEREVWIGFENAFRSAIVQPNA